MNCVAPEILKKTSVSEKSDIYSLGMVLIEMLTLEIPFNEMPTQIKIREKIIESYKPISIEKISEEEIKRYIEKLLEYNPKSRPSIHDLFNDTFLKINEKEDNRIVPILKLKKRNKRFSQIKNTSNFVFCNKIMTTPYHSAVPDDYLVNNSLQAPLGTQDKNIFFQSQTNNFKYNNSQIFNDKNNKSFVNNQYNSNFNYMLNNLNDQSIDRHKRFGMNCNNNMSKKLQKRKMVLFKHDFEEFPYFEESLKMKLENEFESNLNTNRIYQLNQPDFPVQNNINKSPNRKLITDPNLFQNLNHLTTNDQIKEYLNNKLCIINKKNQTSVDGEEENYIANKNLNNQNFDRLTNFDQNSNINKLTTINQNFTSSHDGIFHNLKYLSDFNQTYPYNLSAINCNNPNENLNNNSSHGNTNRNSTNTFSGLIDINFHMSQNSKYINNSNDFNYNNLINFTPKSNQNTEFIFSKNFFDCNKEADKGITNDSNYLVNQNQIENFKSNDNTNKKIKNEDYTNPKLYSCVSFNNAINDGKNNILDSTIKSNNFSHELNNDLNAWNHKTNSNSHNKENDILHESNSHINNGFMKYSKDSSSIIDSDNLIETPMLAKENLSMKIDSYSNCSNDKINNISEKNKSIEQSKLNELINFNKDKNYNHQELNLENKLTNLNLNENLLYSSTGIINKPLQENPNRKNEFIDKVPLISESNDKLINKNSNGNQSIYNIRGSSSDTVINLKKEENKIDSDIEEDKLRKESRDVGNYFYEDINNNYDPNLYDKPKFQIFDTNYDVHLKFMINQDSKIHEIQFTYNLVKDNIPDLMDEIQNEFNFSSENLNHIYETLKKISIYSKFYGNSDILHDNSF